MSWKSVQLGDYLRIKHGFAFKGKHFVPKGDYLLLTPAHFKSEGGFQRRPEKDRYYDGDFPQEYLLKAGQLIVAMTDLTQDARILGAPALIPQDVPCLHNQRLGLVTELSPELNINFLYYLCSAPTYRGQLKGSATGSTVRHTAPDRIYNVDILLPPLPIQKRIAGILSAYDDLIAVNERRIAILEEMAKRVFEEWFLGPINEPIACGELLSFNPKTTVSSSQPVTFVPMGSLSTTSMFISEWEKREKPSGAKFQNGDTLFARITPCLENGKTAYVGFLEEAEIACGSTEFVVMRANNVPKEFVYCLARSEPFRKAAIKSMSGATGRQRASTEALKQFSLQQPDANKLNTFQAISSPCFDQIISLARQNTNLRTTRDLLLPRLISGEIDVSDLQEPTDIRMGTE